MKKIVAIEISRDSIKAAEILSPLSKNPKISKIGEILLPPGVAGESLVYKKEEFLSFLKELWEKEKFSTNKVALSVSGRRFMVREYETSHTSMKDFYSVMKFEVSEVVPEQMENPVVDFYPMYNKGNNTVGLVIATPSKPIEDIIKIITDAKLELMYVDFAPMSIARFIKNNISHEKSKSYVLANIREDSTDILIAKDGIPRIIRVVAKGLPPQTKKKGRHVKEDEYTTTLDDDIKIEKSPLENLAREIRLTVGTQSDSLETSIDQLYITGTRTDPDTMLQLSKLTNLKVTPLDADQVEHKTNIDDELKGSDFVAICAGMRGKK